MRRRDPGPVELEALDPVTGESLGVVPASSARTVDDARVPARTTARAARLRRLAILCGMLAVTCAAAAGYFAVSIAQLRGIERTWRSAMALDAARADADRQVRELLGDAASVDDQVTLVPLGAIGTEVAGGLRRHERTLADRRIFDSKVSDLRDAMVEALEFRRFQLSPTRNRIGDTPLQKVEVDISTQLDRWGLAPVRVAEPELASLAPALAQLRRYTDVETGVTLFALDDTTLHTIDVDGSTMRQRKVPFAGNVISVSGGVAIGDGRLVVVYPPDPDADPMAVIEDEDGSGIMAVAAGDGSGDLWVVQRGGTTVRRFHVDGTSSGWATEPALLPRGRTVVGSTSDHLVLETPGGGLDLWSPSAPLEPTSLASEGARFLDAERSLVLFQGPLPFNRNAGSAFLHRYDVGTARRDLIGLPRTDAAAASLGPGGIAAVAAGPLAGRLGSILVLPPDAAALVGGRSGPRASVEEGSIAWAHDARSVFWLTPDGAIAIGYGSGPDTQLLRTGLHGLDRLAVMGR